MAPHSFASVWRVWWLGDATGDLLVAPAILTAASAIAARRIRRQALEACLAALGIGALGALVFWTREPLPYALFPVIFLVAVRCRQFGAALSNVALSAVAVWFTAHGHGPYAVGSPDASLLRAQAFVGVVALTALLVAAMRTEGGRAAEAERAAGESRARLQALLDHAPMPMSLRDLDGRFLEINRLGAELMGATVESVLAQPGARAIDPGVAAILGEHERQVIETGEAVTFELAPPKPDGTSHDYLVTKYPVRDEAGRVRGVGGVSLDVTDRKRAERLFRGLLEAAPDAMVIADEAGEIVLVNAQTEALFGYAREELIGQRIELLIPERFRERHIGHRDAFAAKPTTRAMGGHLELAAVRKDGSEFPVEISLSPLQTETRTLTSAAVRDISVRRAAEEARRAAEARIRAIFEHIPAGLAMRGLDGRYLHVNSDVARSLGQTPTALVGHDPGEHLDPETRARVRAEDEAMARSREPIQQELRVLHTDGSDHDYFVVRYPVLDENDDLTGFGAFSLDITARKRAEARLAESELRQRLLLASLPDALVALYDRELNCLLLQGAMVSRTGLDPDRLLGRSIRKTMPPEQLEQLEPLVVNALAGVAGSVEHTSALTGVTYDLQVVSYRLGDGTIAGAFVVARDITARKQAELEIRRERDYSTSILRSMREGFFLSSGWCDPRRQRRAVRAHGVCARGAPGSQRPVPVLGPGSPRAHHRATGARARQRRRRVRGHLHAQGRQPRPPRPPPAPATAPSLGMSTRSSM